MASVTWIDANFTFNSVDLSDFVKSVTLKYSAEMLDETAMGDTTRKNKGGLKDWSIDVEFKQDFAASAVDVSLFSLVGTTATVLVRPVAASAVAATNPNYTGTGILETYEFGGGVGDLLPANITIRAAGTLSRATS